MATSTSYDWAKIFSFYQSRGLSGEEELSDDDWSCLELLQPYDVSKGSFQRDKFEKAVRRNIVPEEGSFLRPNLRGEGRAVWVIDEPAALPRPADHFKPSAVKKAWLDGLRADSTATATTTVAEEQEDERQDRVGVERSTQQEKRGGHGESARKRVQGEGNGEGDGDGATEGVQAQAEADHRSETPPSSPPLVRDRPYSRRHTAELEEDLARLQSDKKDLQTQISNYQKQLESAQRRADESEAEARRFESLNRQLEVHNQQLLEWGQRQIATFKCNQEDLIKTFRDFCRLSADTSMTADMSSSSMDYSG